nr:MAG TPA: hypothetical protein [Crassvirales sp.]
MGKEGEVILDVDTIMDETPMQEVVEATVKQPRRRQAKQSAAVDEPIVNCLRNERVIVKHVPKETGIVRDPKHILYGGMAEGAVRWLTVPRLTSGMYVNVLTNAEKACLEEVMGLEYNALSIYNKVDNFWDNYQVRLTKQDNFLNLADPDDYIKYKVLLANKDLIAPSLQDLEDHPKATYQFVIIHENEESQASKKKMNATMQAYMEFGKIQENADILRTIIETIDGRPTSKNSKIEFLQEKVGKLIQADARLFVRVATDPLLSTKVLIKKAIEGGLISNRGGMLYLKADGTPLCEDNEEPTLNIAAKYLNMPKHQELKFAIEAKLKK